MSHAQHHISRLVAAILVGVGVGAMAARADTEQDAAQWTSKTKGQTAASDAKHLQALDKKLDQVLADQQAILDKLDSMTEELRIIKIRATR